MSAATKCAVIVAYSVAMKVVSIEGPSHVKPTTDALEW
jgi:hypothetical protein